VQLFDVPAQRHFDVVRSAPGNNIAHAAGKHEHLHLQQARHQTTAAINVRCLEGVELPALKVKHFNGRDL
jgi:hypothetical protein